VQSGSSLLMWGRLSGWPWPFEGREGRPEERWVSQRRPTWSLQPYATEVCCCLPGSKLDRHAVFQFCLLACIPHRSWRSVITSIVELIS
jgi:hypothetical protein